MNRNQFKLLQAILVVLFFPFVHMFGQNYVENGLTYKVIWDSVSLELMAYQPSAFSGDMRLLHIPSTVVHQEKTYKVKRVGSNAFYGLQGIEAIVVDDGIEIIGNYAFESCINLKSVYIPASVRVIGEGIFGSCYNLKEIVVDSLNENFESPEGSNAIIADDELVAACPNARIPSSVTIIDDYAFYHCNTMEQIVIPEGVEKIGFGAFQGCSSLKRITLPESLKRIGPDAFHGCTSLDSVFIPKNVSEILGANIFAGCYRLTSIVVDKDNTVFDSRNDCNGIVRKEDSTLIASCATTTIGEDIKALDNDCFKDVILHTIRIPKSIEKLSGAPFFGCFEIDSLFVDPDNAFYVSPQGANAILTRDGKTLVVGCRSTEIPADVETIDDYAFVGRYTKPMLKLPEGLKKVGTSAFSGCNMMIELIIPSSVEDISSSAFSDCYNLNVVQVLSPIEKINYGTFSNCSSLSVLSLPEGLKQIDNLAFKNCVSLKNVHLPSTIELVKDDAFNGCTSLKYVHLPSTIGVVERNTFYICKQLTDVVMQAGHTKIDKYAFVGCDALK